MYKQIKTFSCGVISFKPRLVIWLIPEVDFWWSFWIVISLPARRRFHHGFIQLSFTCQRTAIQIVTLCWCTESCPRFKGHLFLRPTKFFSSISFRFHLHNSFQTSTRYAFTSTFTKASSIFHLLLPFEMILLTSSYIVIFSFWNTSFAIINYLT